MPVLLEDDRVFAWGQNQFGQLGNGNTEDQSTPGQVVGLPEGVGIAQFCLGYTHNACVLKDGRIFTWGDNSSGQLGIGNYESQSRAVQVLGLPEGVPVKQLCLDRYCSVCLLGGWSNFYVG